MQLFFGSIVPSAKLEKNSLQQAKHDSRVCSPRAVRLQEELNNEPTD